MHNCNNGLIYPTCLRIINKHLILLILCISFIPFLYINAAALSGIDEGITAFRQGDYTNARTKLTKYVECRGEREALVRAYLFAMNDEANVEVKPSDAVISRIQMESERGDPVFQVLEGRLHLMGLLIESNRERGLSLLHTASGRKEGYAYYTLGLLYSGRLGEEGDLEIAANWYKTAIRKNFHEATLRMAEIRDPLDRLEPAAGAGCDGGSTRDGLSEIFSDYREDGDHGAERGAGVGSSTVIGMRLEKGEDKKRLEGESTYTRTTVGEGIIAAGVHPAAEADRGPVPSKEEDKSKPGATGGAGSHGSTTGPSSTQVINIGATAEDLSSVVGGGDARSIVSAGAGGAIVTIPPAVPAIAVGHEAFYRQFLGGRLEYRPTLGSDEGMIILPFRDILAPIAGTANPLSATFDLSRCGDMGKYISIHMGYKKVKIPANKGKLEIWICPKFLVERELEIFRLPEGCFSQGQHPFARIMHKWKAPMGYFWTWGSYNVTENCYDYSLSHFSMDENNLYDKWISIGSGDKCSGHGTLYGIFSFPFTFEQFSCKIMPLE